MHDVGQLAGGAGVGERDAQLLAGEAGIAVAQPDRHEVGVPLPQAHVADLRGHDGAVQPGWGVEDEGVHPEGPPREAGHVAPPWVDGGATRQPLRKVGDHAGRWFGGVDEGCLAERRAGHVIHGPAVGQTDGVAVVADPVVAALGAAHLGGVEVEQLRAVVLQPREVGGVAPRGDRCGRHRCPPWHALSHTGVFPLRRRTTSLTRAPAGAPRPPPGRGRRSRAEGRRRACVRCG